MERERDCKKTRGAYPGWETKSGRSGWQREAG